MKLSGRDAVYYLCLRPSGPEVINLVLYTYPAFHKYALYDYFKYGLVFGVLMCMAFYNLFIWISLRGPGSI